MNINEELAKQDNKKIWRDLVRKYHPDNKKTGDEKIMKKINNAYEKGDEVFERLHDELTGKKSATDDYDRSDMNYGQRDDDIGGRGPIYSLLHKIQKKNNFVKKLVQSKMPTNKNVLESFDLILNNGYIIKITVSTMGGGRGVGRMVDVNIQLMDGTKPIKDEGPVPIADDDMLEKRINELIEKAKKIKEKSKEIK